MKVAARARCVESLDDAREARKVAEEELVVARRTDVERRAAAVVAGTAPPKQRSEGKALLVTEDARRAEAVAEAAVDQAGDLLLQAIEEAREKWLTALDREAASASSRFTNALTEAGAALDELGWALAPRAWLARFDADRARIGARDGGVESLRYRPDLPEELADAFAALATLGTAARATRQAMIA